MAVIIEISYFFVVMTLSQHMHGIFLILLQCIAVTVLNINDSVHNLMPFMVTNQKYLGLVAILFI